MLFYSLCTTLHHENVLNGSNTQSSSHWTDKYEEFEMLYRTYYLSMVVPSLPHYIFGSYPAAPVASTITDLIW